MTKRGVREKKEKRLTHEFKQFEELDRNDRTRYEGMPSPKGDNWRDYIRHRLIIMKNAIATYTTKQYTRLKFDKYIEENRTSDKMAALLV